MIVIHNSPCKHSSKLQLSIRFTPSRCLDVRQDWYPMYYPEGMKARVSPVQSIEPHRILAPTRDHRRSQHEARGGNCLLLNFQISNDFASRFASSNKKMIHISTSYYKLVFVLQRCSLPLIPRTLVLREGEVCFRSFENIRKF